MLSPHTLLTEHLAIFSIWLNFGAFLAMVFPENDGLDLLEIIVYYIEHCMGSGLGTIVMSMAGRFDILRYLNRQSMLLGHVYFSFYMREFLTPISHFTWANLNHNLCYLDPPLVIFDTPYYFFFGEFYLGTIAMVYFYASYVLNYAIKRVLCNFAKDKIH